MVEMLESGVDAGCRFREDTPDTDRLIGPGTGLGT